MSRKIGLYEPGDAVAPLLRFLIRRPGGALRVRPDFLIVGVQKGGTSFLYNLLRRHPHVAPALIKEIHYFDRNFTRPDTWYRAFFPLRLSMALAEQLRGQRVMTGEASPYYIFHPHALRRIAAMLPDVKLIVLLRNPVERAYSHYQHMVRYGFESLSFEEALAAEEGRLNEEYEKMLADETYDSDAYRRFSYVRRGLYLQQLQTLFRLFSSSQVLLIQSEQLYARPHEEFANVLEFLGLPRWSPKQVRAAHVGKYAAMNPAIRAQLHEYFAPHNKELSAFLGTEWDWC